ncbi:hypothetical protein PG985_007768 [Apiospora marii]|uniref:Uncharacterized protein n=1 Tax=Apiospora marii TaxID=335849 RepID=A0ABR1SSH0_9PEZI
MIAGNGARNGGDTGSVERDGFDDEGSGYEEDMMQEDYGAGKISRQRRIAKRFKENSAYKPFRIRRTLSTELYFPKHRPVEGHPPDARGTGLQGRQMPAPRKPRVWYPAGLCRHIHLQGPG